MLFLILMVCIGLACNKEDQYEYLDRFTGTYNGTYVHYDKNPLFGVTSWDCPATISVTRSTGEAYVDVHVVRCSSTLNYQISVGSDGVYQDKTFNIEWNFFGDSIYFHRTIHSYYTQFVGWTIESEYITASK
jgi:hypothetical protein